eukprot:1146079-Pelagomonas_calceolata.AAC.9
MQHIWRKYMELADPRHIYPGTHMHLLTSYAGVPQPVKHVYLDAYASGDKLPSAEPEALTYGIQFRLNGT